jgi:hypothetical protein
MSTIAAEKEEVERKEIFVAHSSREGVIFVSIMAVGFIAMVTAVVPSVRTLSPSDKLRFLIIAWGFAVFMIAVVVASWRWGERYKDRPIMVLDADGFWHRRLGRVMPWSKVTAVKKVDELGIVVSCIWDWFEIPYPSTYVDRDGVRYCKETLCREMRAYWVKYRP